MSSVADYYLMCNLHFLYYIFITWEIDCSLDIKVLLCTTRGVNEIDGGSNGKRKMERKGVRGLIFIKRVETEEE